MLVITRVINLVACSQQLLITNVVVEEIILLYIEKIMPKDTMMQIFPHWKMKILENMKKVIILKKFLLNAVLSAVVWLT
jgi:hypothetical protein